VRSHAPRPAARRDRGSRRSRGARQPIRGIISIYEDGGLLEVLVRLPAKDDALARAILRAEETCLRRGERCLADDN